MSDHRPPGRGEHVVGEPEGVVAVMEDHAGTRLLGIVGEESLQSAGVAMRHGPAAPYLDRQQLFGRFDHEVHFQVVARGCTPVQNVWSWRDR